MAFMPAAIWWKERIDADLLAANRNREKKGKGKFRLINVGVIPTNRRN